MFLWWIDTFTHAPRHYYPYRIQGENTATGEAISWTIPRLWHAGNQGGHYAFRLREVR